MEITAKIREKLIARFEGVNYRQIIADRAKVHPNTVANVLYGRHHNDTVADALVQLGLELKAESLRSRKKTTEIEKQL